MMDTVRRLAEATPQHPPGELRRRALQAAGATGLAVVVIGAILTASASDNSRRAICTIARGGIGATCEERVASLAETASGVRLAGTLTVGQLQSPVPQPQEAPHDPSSPCGPDDGRALCTCKRELLDQANGLRLTLEPPCRTILRAGRPAAG